MFSLRNLVSGSVVEEVPFRRQALGSRPHEGIHRRARQGGL